MRRFYFNLRTPRGLEIDRTGCDLPSAEEAYLLAYKAVPGLAMEALSRDEGPNCYTFEIRNEAGQLLWELPFREALGRILGLSRPGPPALG